VPRGLPLGAGGTEAVVGLADGPRGHDHTAISLGTLIEDDRVEFYTRAEAAVKGYFHRLAESFRMQQKRVERHVESLGANAF